MKRPQLLELGIRPAKHICQRIDSARQAGGAAGRSSAWRDLRNLIGAQAEGGDGANT